MIKNQNTLVQVLKPSAIYLLIILGLTFLSFSSALDNNFTHCDDDSYVTGNLLIRRLDFQSIQDIFYSLFYLLALISYWNYLNCHCQAPQGLKRSQDTSSFIKTKGNTSYAFSILWGFLSILSKPMALSLPLVFFILDWFSGRKMN